MLVILVEERLRYYEALDLAHTRGEYGPFLALVVSCLGQSFARYWGVLGR
ncbi:MAG: hypothetical protein WCI67_20400 [Chloroflexales bacterium]